MRWREGEGNRKKTERQGKKEREAQRDSKRGRQGWEGQSKMAPDPVRLVVWVATLGSLQKVTEPACDQLLCLGGGRAVGRAISPHPALG